MSGEVVANAAEADAGGHEPGEGFGETGERCAFAPHESMVNLRLPVALVEALNAAAQREGMTFARYVRARLEASVSG
jgi:hypothetical protein